MLELQCRSSGAQPLNHWAICLSRPGIELIKGNEVLKYCGKHGLGEGKEIEGLNKTFGLRMTLQFSRFLFPVNDMTNCWFLRNTAGKTPKLHRNLPYGSHRKPTAMGKPRKKPKRTNSWAAGGEWLGMRQTLDNRWASKGRVLGNILNVKSK